MANRNTDTDKWKKTWFRNLTPIEKCFWTYITDSCNHAGIWEVDFDLASVFIKAELDVPKIKETFKKQFIEIDNGKRWYIIDFISFQCKCDPEQLNPKNQFHKSILSLLQKYEILKILGAYKPLTSPSQGVKGNGNDISNGNDIGNEKETGIKYEDKKEYYLGIYNQFLPPELQQDWCAYLDYCYERGDIKFNRSTITEQIKYLQENIKDAKKIMRQSIKNNWKGLFEVKDGKGNSGSKKYDYQTGDGVEFKVIQ